MRIAIVTDAWSPQVNGVVTILRDLQAALMGLGHEPVLIEPTAFARFRCPGYGEIELAWRPRRGVERRLCEVQPDAIHIATEGPLGMAARRVCLDHGWAFTTAFHTRFPDVFESAIGLPQAWSYAWLRRFHAASSRVMVPSAGALAILAEHGFARLAPWAHGIDLAMFRPREGSDLGLPRPVFLYVGRVSYEKNIEAFVDLDLPGSKVVCGGGPLLEQYRQRYPAVHWCGRTPRAELPAIFSAADVFVCPSRTETFGLVMLEALACGTPVAAFPVAGPLDVVGNSGAGVLDIDLRHAALSALAVPRGRARARALEFDLGDVSRQFVGHLVAAGCGAQGHVTDLSQKLHKLGA